MKKDDWNEDSDGYFLKEEYEQQYGLLKDTVPDSYGYTTHFFVVSHANAADVRKVINWLVK